MNRYDFVYLFDVADGNPNGDPDLGNQPRQDQETQHGLVTDVCLKRKIRNYVTVAKNGAAGFDIYVKEKAVLGRSHSAAFADLGIQLGEETRSDVPEAIRDDLAAVSLPDGLAIEEGDSRTVLVVAADADIKEVKAALKEETPSKGVKDFLTAVLKTVKARKPTGEETQRGRQWMCQHFYDIRIFGAVMALKSAPNCGQVRGPVQLTFARSIDPILPQESSITRCAVATEAEAEKQGGDNRTMGRKFTVPYGLYRCHGFISPQLATQTGFSDADLELLWKALEMMWDTDHSAARGLMAPRKLLIFKHDNPLGNAAAHRLFEKVTIQRKDATKPTRAFADYLVTLDRTMPAGVELIERF
ncbi:MAG: type I-C CRISPR-associated protein Cas7/Csd2 [Planctomycetota bacterium]|nr:type I-C CRISPR-associated protein Cas7/Csd2 [Planctomycetota bacterium]